MDTDIGEPPVRRNPLALRTTPRSTWRIAPVEGLTQFARTHPWWQTLLLCVGFVSLVTIIAVLFLGIDGRPRSISTTDPLPAVDSPHFTAAVARLVNVPVERGGTIDILNNGDGFVPALLDSLQAARETINVLVFIWEDGVLSDAVIDTLIERQQAGVQVRVLLDGLGARAAPNGRFSELRDAGGRVERFRTPRFGTWMRFHRRNHRRSIVIDGRVGFVGGMAIKDTWLGNAEGPDAWRDMMFRVTGPMAESLQAAFADSWVATSGEILVGPRFHPAPAAPAEEAPGVERFLHHVHSPADDDHAMAYFLLLPILAAQERVSIVTPYFIPDPPLKDALKERARAGVDVRLLLPGPNIDHGFVRWSAQTHYQDLLEAGVRIYEYEPTFLHSKFIVVDGLWSIVGSPNMNSRSRLLDEENAFGILDRDFAQRLQAEFTADLGQSVEIRLEEWSRRPFPLRALQLFARILDQQS
jgi:cardiolipin synthase A/B